ncbi:CoA-acylating methylmalonate-semialdehyde dehydrogenase [Legionella jordanis]|uniref:methylmalonate-semialdehyde dehydrogenase (CoA acylating) n=1 Tax=Legionella jordanis TaxID=456 RepID=A0A0W0VC85_9GAMM|nr:CoA-acylating methylmalonate-semialdehyde dehydrogenase [Legionella jordanis]KTD17722.1 methylmalonate-semialdehyde dehydrogenase [Legionella jordanis]RMX01586.1 methylmalonate-semialdehyde dehydrogenase (CoA acylating) [Legionella jordanis]RMX21582.1 methylmalonate-semialdehyde dehydrogenase (CoA acylating) [Legionella jordanis]VEH11344.1 methylmalonate-semialdehyde dehydrogenase [Legionella jordanis]
MGYIVPHFIAGETVLTETAHFRTIFNPALGEDIGRAYFADSALCDKVVATAKAAWPAWAETTALKRARILFKFRELLDKYQLDLARIVTREHGKTLEDAKGSVARAIEVVEFHCGLVTQLQGDFSADVSTHIDCHTFRQPLGVCAGVSPFNFPVMVPVWMMIPAIASGNTFILKPSEQDPSAPIRLLELLSEAGLPNGVANCIQGDKEVVEHLLKHPDISAFTAVASTPVSEAIYRKATAYGKRAHTFGGAKNHCVVMPDADLDQAANAIVGAAYGSAGERCMAISAVVTVGDNTAEQLLQKLIPLVRAIRVDAGDAKDSDMGPLISAEHRQKVLSAINEGVAEGATLLVDGRAFKHKEHPQGYFLGPSLFDQVKESMSIYQNEIFGPVLVVLRAATFEEALSLVNRHQYGNGTAIFTRDGYSAREYSRRVQAGMVGINIPIPVPIASHPFGGWKRSSFGDTNMHGVESINFYTRRKTVTSKWPVTELANGAFNMPTHD